MKCDILIRDIAIFKDWFIEEKDLYKAKDVDEFEDKIKKILKNELPSLRGNAYHKAQERDIKEVGRQLHAVYNEVLHKE